MALTSEEALSQADKKYEFAKFKVKMKMNAEQIREAFYEQEYEYAKSNDEWLYDMVVAYYEKLSLSDDEYLDLYMDNIDWENDDGTNE